MKLSHITLVTHQFERMIDFYRGVFEIEPERTGDNYARFSLQTGAIALWRQSEARALGELGSSENRSLLIEIEVPDVECWYEELDAKGMPWVQRLTLQPWGQQVCYFRDPDGNLLNLFSNVPAEGRSYGP
jgi:catechol 2,3-dioxygenase-like lactoylglutathione lyase family enzyme